MEVDTIWSSIRSDGSAKMTLTVGEDDHRFSVWSENDKAVVQYEETLSWRGIIRVSEPDEDIFRALMTSDAMTEYLEQNDLKAVKRNT